MPTAATGANPFGEQHGADWAGFAIGSGNWVDTGSSWLGHLHVEHTPWNFHGAGDAWIYLSEDQVDEDGAWLFRPHPDYIKNLPTWSFHVENAVSHTFKEGYNWNSATVLMSHWWWPENAAYGGRTYSEEDWARYFDLWHWSGSAKAGAHRLGFQIHYWEPEKGKPEPESPHMQRLYLFLDHMKERDMEAYITNWNFGGIEWIETEANHPATAEDRQAVAESLAGLLYHLREIRGYTNVVGVSLANEPDGLQGAWEGNHYAPYLWPIYPLLDHELRNLGIRDDIRIYGPDTTAHGNDRFVSNILSNLDNYGAYIDVASDHLYRLNTWRVDNYGLLQAALSSRFGREFPVIIAEFGSGGPSGQGALSAEEEYVLYQHMVMQAARVVIHGLNRKLSGFNRWQFAFDAYLKFAGITASDPDYWFKPYGPVYYPHAVLARYMKKGWKVYESNGPDGLEHSVSVALLRCPDEQAVSVLMANEGTVGVKVTIHLEELPNLPATLNRVFVSDRWSGLRDGGPVELTEKTATVILPRESITTLTTLPLGNLAAPMEYALPRDPGNGR